jgi:hypothetical protein
VVIIVGDLATGEESTVNRREPAVKHRGTIGLTQSRLSAIVAGWGWVQNGFSNVFVFQKNV